MMWHCKGWCWCDIAKDGAEWCDIPLGIPQALLLDMHKRKETEAYCSTLQHTAARCNALQYTAICTAMHCNALQHTATHCDPRERSTLQHTAAHCNTLQHTATPYNTLQHTATHSNPQESAHMHATLASAARQWLAVSDSRTGTTVWLQRGEHYWGVETSICTRQQWCRPSPLSASIIYHFPLEWLNYYAVPWYVCVYLYIYIYTYICMYVCTYICTLSPPNKTQMTVTTWWLRSAYWGFWGGHYWGGRNLQMNNYWVKCKQNLHLGCCGGHQKFSSTGQ